VSYNAFGNSFQVSAFEVLDEVVLGANSSLLGASIDGEYFISLLICSKFSLDDSKAC
jgi:hypothetical protein